MAQALELFEIAEQRYAQGQLDEAVRLLLEARGLHPEPVLLYNLARAYEGLGQLQDARQAYVQYLEEDPEAQGRGAIERRIEAIDEQLRREQALAEAAVQEGNPEAAEVPPPPPQRQRSMVGPWLVTGLGITTAAAGAVFGGLALRNDSDADIAQSHAGAVATFERAERFALSFNVLISVGATLAVAGLVWAIIELRRRRAVAPRAEAPVSATTTWSWSIR